MKTVLLTLALVVMGGVAFGASDDFESYTLGGLSGQGAAGDGWAGGWYLGGTNPENSFQVVDDNGNQYLSMFGSSSSGHQAFRMLDPIAENFTFSFSAYITPDTPVGATQEFVLRDTVSGRRALHLKWEPWGMFRVNEDYVMVFGNPDQPEGFLPMTGGWVDVLFEVNWATQTIRTYWETASGLTFAHERVGFRDGFDSNLNSINQLEVRAPRTGSAPGDPNKGMMLDNISIIPEPMTLALLGLGSLGLIGRKRR